MVPEDGTDNSCVPARIYKKDLSTPKSATQSRKDFGRPRTPILSLSLIVNSIHISLDI